MTRVFEDCFSVPLDSVQVEGWRKEKQVAISRLMSEV